MMARQIPLTQGKFAIVDDENYEWLNQFKWSIDGSGYPQRAVKTQKGWRPRRMHRDILDLHGRQMSDHINMNKLDNRSCNLRKCDAFGNARNRGLNKNNNSGYKGVFWQKELRKWRAKIVRNRQSIHLGCFENKIDAAKAYNKKAKEIFGEFAFLNSV